MMGSREGLRQWSGYCYSRRFLLGPNSSKVENYQFKILICEDWMEWNYLLTFIPNSDENPNMTDKDLMGKACMEA